MAKQSKVTGVNVWGKPGHEKVMVMRKRGQGRSKERTSKAYSLSPSSRKRLKTALGRRRFPIRTGEL